MSERGEVRYGNTTIPYEITRSKRRKKTVGITIDGQHGVRVAAPLGVPRGEIEAIVARRAPWILRKASDETLQAAPRRFVSGESIPYLGRRVRMVVTEGPFQRTELRFEHWRFEIRAPDGIHADERQVAIRALLTRWYRERAAARLEGRVEHWSRVLGQHPTKVLVRDQRQRWASCAPDGTLRFNWRIVMAEPALIDYVVVHELVHLSVKNHSHDFWSEVAQLLPDYELSRRRLREVGPYLSL